MSKTEAYRGEDKTLELIRERTLADLPKDVKPDDISNWNEYWDATCDKMAEEMRSEGLNNTADEILKWKDKINH